MSGDWLCVDYGTSTTVATLRRADGRTQPLLWDSSPLLPSAVFAAADGRILVGRDAERQARVDPARFEANPKRRIDEPDVLLGPVAYPLPQLVAATLRRAAEEAARTAGGPVAGVTLTHPVAWGPVRRQVLVTAAAQAGLPAPLLLAEPVAAAGYFTAVLGRGLDVGQAILVYDLGAGTFDASVVQRRPDGLVTLTSQGLADVGGLDLDATVVSHVGTVLGRRAPDTWQRLMQPASDEDSREFALLWSDARQAREALSREPSATVYLPRFDSEVVVTREEFEAAATDLLGRTVEVATATLLAARLPAGRFAGCFLVGGATRTPLVATLLHRALGVAPTVIEEPQLVVSAGAATYPPPRRPGGAWQVPPPGSASPAAAPVPVSVSVPPAAAQAPVSVPPGSVSLAPVRGPAPFPGPRARPSGAPSQRRGGVALLVALVAAVSVALAGGGLLAYRNLGGFPGKGAPASSAPGSLGTSPSSAPPSGPVYVTPASICDSTDFTPLVGLLGATSGAPRPAGSTFERYCNQDFAGTVVSQQVLGSFFSDAAQARSRFTRQGSGDTDVPGLGELASTTYSDTWQAGPDEQHVTRHQMFRLSVLDGNLTLRLDVLVPYGKAMDRARVFAAETEIASGVLGRLQR